MNILNFFRKKKLTESSTIAEEAEEIKKGNR